MKNKKKGHLLEALVGLVLTLLVAFSYATREPFLAAVEYKAYDLRAKFRESLQATDKIVVVAVDDDSIAQIGRWPWTRTRIAAGLDRIQQDGPKVIGLNILFSEAEQHPGLDEIGRLRKRYDELVAARRILPRKGVDFDAEFSSSTVALDSDARLLASVSTASDVVMPLFFVPDPTRARPDAAPPAVSSAAAVATAFPPGSLVAGEKMIPPLESYTEASVGLGHSNLMPETDGVLRRDTPVIAYDGRFYPSYALRLAMAYDGVPVTDLKVQPGVAVTAGPLRVPIDSDGETAITFLSPRISDVIRRVSFASLFGDTLKKDYFKDKIVLIGHTATGVATDFATPLSGRVPAVEIIAQSLENILDSRYLVRPPWAVRAEWGLLAFVGLFIMLVLPRLRAFWGLVVSLMLALLILGGGTYFFVAGQWIKIGYALSLLVGGYLVVISKGFLVTEKGKELVEASAIETNKMLGLSFQGQGMLDMAFEKFRLCPLDENLKDTLYNLALDFERKRQFSKAAAVLDHIAAKDPKYKDIAEKTKMLKAASEGAVFGGVGGGKKDGTVMITGGSTKPTLGRYEIEKELGRGAMGVVYLGRDPKINRMVAIKTMSLEDGSDEASAKEVKERFFREAESAGTLNHPGIVRIFDAGEENEVAYIAMELLDGTDLTKRCAKDQLLPVDKVVEYVATVADALDYAHAQGIVHRDIKPANIMLLKDGSIRVADFGIARIAASSKTATGTVMGTPSYMSPEQVAGKKVDGRSDLFSLTVALYELLTGEKPFKGGDGIGTLLFQIANDPHPDPLSVRADLPPGLKAVIDKGLAKDPEKRFQRGSEMAAALRAALSGGGAAPAPAAAPAVPPAAVTAELTQPVAAKEPAAALPPPPPPPPEPAAEATAKFTIPGLNDLPAPPEPAPVTIPGLNDLPEPAPTAEIEPTQSFTTDAPPPPPPAAGIERTQAVEAAAPPPPPPPPPSAPAGAGEMRIELPIHTGVGADSAPPPPPPPSEPDPGATLRIEPTQNFDATLKIKPNPQEPS
jgi:serine/threonine-protein kinase